jgi:glyoxalase family protein
VRLEGVHHVTLITGDAPRNVAFYTRVLGLRLVKKTVNQDDPTVYHLFYADEKGDGRTSFFEYPGAARGKAPAAWAHDRLAGRIGGRDRLREAFQGEAENIERTRSLVFEGSGRCPA